MVIQWLRIHLAMWETLVRSLVQEDATKQLGSVPQLLSLHSGALLQTKSLQ